MRTKKLYFDKNNKVYKQAFRGNLYVTNYFFSSFKSLNNVIYVK